MRFDLLAATAVAALIPSLAIAQAPVPAAPAAGAVQADPAAPKGKLPAGARPLAYRLAFTIDPDQPRFSGHDEIDVALTAPTSKLYMHGRDLHVGRVVATAGARTVPATYTQVDSTGVVRLDFAQPLEPGTITLSFDYDGAFGDSATGLYRIKVKDRWYSWTQFESIDARAAYPSFDEPGFKTPFAISVTTKPGYTVVSNAPEASVGKDGAMERHVFQPTRPLPTYLVALVTGPFLRPTGAVPPSPERVAAMPLGVVATQAQAGKLDYAMAETPRIVSLLERYFGQSFPFPKLDQIGSPVMPGAMENAGADVYGDGILFLPKAASTGEKQTFGMVVSHELSHQWFGDLVTPAWWDDIWLNESFANWMGYRIGNEWRPELNIGVGALDEGFRSMNTDALEVGRPIHQPITDNSQIDSAFDSVTYGKGGQVVAMIAAYLGDEKFRAGVRLHVSRHMYGNATSEQFFAALAEAAHDPNVLAAMKSFVDQPGVPVVFFSAAEGKGGNVLHATGGLEATQSRYAFLGRSLSAQRWTIPLCYRAGTTKTCTLLTQASQALPGRASGVLMPNVGGTGYYRFDMPAQNWDELIATGATLSPGEALATTDSLWAAFRAGHLSATELVTAARVMANNPDSNASLANGQRLAGLMTRGLVPEAAMPAMRKLITRIYAPRLAALGTDPAAGAYAADTPDRQQLRYETIQLVAQAGDDPALSAKLLAAATAYLGGKHEALDPVLLGDGLGLVARRDGLAGAKRLVAFGLASEDNGVRGASLGAAASTGNADVAAYLLSLKDPKLRQLDRLQMVGVLARTRETSKLVADWILANYSQIASGNGIFFASRVPQMLGGQCDVERSAEIDRVLGPKVRALGAGELEFKRVVEQVRHCGDLKAARSTEIGAAVAGAAL